MKKLIEQIKLKAQNCNDSTKESRARKGAYVDCIMMIKELLNHPAPTPEKLGELFDAKAVAWDEVSPGLKVMESQEFIEIVQELISQTRQQVETEINLPTNEAVKEWFCEGDNSSSFWNSGSWKNGQVCDEIIDALKYFIVTWQPVRNSKQPLTI